MGTAAGAVGQVSVALRLPLAVGLKVTLTAQLELLARLEGQLLVWPKSPLLVPVMATLLMVTAELPVFETVTA